MFGRYLDASVLEVTSQGGPPIEQVGAYFASLPPDRFPNMTELSATMFEGDDDDRFEFGLDLLIRGMAAYAAAPTPKRRHHTQTALTSRISADARVDALGFKEPSARPHHRA